MARQARAPAKCNASRRTQPLQQSAAARARSSSAQRARRLCPARACVPSACAAQRRLRRSQRSAACTPRERGGVPPAHHCVTEPLGARARWRAIADVAGRAWAGRDVTPERAAPVAMQPQVRRGQRRQRRHARRAQSAACNKVHSASHAPCRSLTARGAARLPPVRRRCLRHAALRRRAHGACHQVALDSWIALTLFPSRAAADAHRAPPPPPRNALPRLLLA